MDRERERDRETAPDTIYGGGKDARLLQKGWAAWYCTAKCIYGMPAYVVDAIVC